jgi:hypothetical protein
VLAEIVLVHLVTTILNDNVECERFAQILNGFGLSGTGGALRSTTIGETQRVGQRHVGTISQRSDNKTTVIALVLVTVRFLETKLFAFDHHLLLVRLDTLSLFESKLGLPAESTNIIASSVSSNLLNDLSVMLLDNNEGDDLVAVT